MRCETPRLLFPFNLWLSSFCLSFIAASAEAALVPSSAFWTRLTVSDDSYDYIIIIQVRHEYRLLTKINHAKLSSPDNLRSHKRCYRPWSQVRRCRSWWICHRWIPVGEAFESTSCSIMRDCFGKIPLMYIVALPNTESLDFLLTN